MRPTTAAVAMMPTAAAVAVPDLSLFRCGKRGIEPAYATER
jgi:hypothetical protein